MKNIGDYRMHKYILFVVSFIILVFGISNVKASEVTVLPGNGGTIPLFNHLQLKQNVNTLKDITTNADGRAETTDVNGGKQLIIKKADKNDKITISYGKVGAYNGQDITAKLVISNIKLHDKSHDVINGITHDDISFNVAQSFSSGISSINNIARMNLSFEFFDNNGNQLNLQNSFLTISSLDGPVETTYGFEYAAFLNSGKIYIAQNSVVHQTTDPLDNGQSVIGGYKENSQDFPYFSATGATFEVYGESIDFIYGSTRATRQDNQWVTPTFSLSTVTLGAPEIKQPVITADSNSVTAGGSVTYDLKQSVNTLNEDLLNKYNSWSETLQLPSGFQYLSAKIVDDNGASLNSADFKINYDKNSNKVVYQLTKQGIEKMGFQGEDYHFKVTGKTSNTTIDQTKLSVSGTTLIDGQSKQASNNKVIASNKRKILVHHYMTDSKDKVTNDQTVELGYGRSYRLSPLSYKAVGYTYNKNHDINTKGIVSDATKEATFYYDADPFYIHVNYLLENGSKLDQLNILGLFGDTYTTEASDYDDLYTLVTEKTPQNKTGKVTEKPIFVNYFYRPTTGKWVDVGNAGSLLTRTDYKNRVRSISQNYSNGTGYSVKYDLNSKQVAITSGNSNTKKIDKDFIKKYGSQHLVHPISGEQLMFDIAKDGQVNVTRFYENEAVFTTFDKTGMIETTTAVLNDDYTLSSQKDTVDGKKSVITKEEFSQGLGNGYTITAQRNIDLNAQLAPLPDGLIPVKDVDTDAVVAVPERGDKESSFNEGIPITDPKTNSEENTSPNNNPDVYQTPLEVSKTTDVQVTKDGKEVFSDKINNGKEQDIYQTPHKKMTIAAGADDRGFFADKFDGNKKPKSYTMGLGYSWDPTNKTKHPFPLPSTGEIKTIGLTIVGIILVSSAFILTRKRGMN